MSMKERKVMKNKMKYRIVCHDDPSEDILYYESRSEVMWSIGDGFGNGIGYGSIREFNKEKRGIHSIQTKKNGRWVNVPWKKKGNKND